jgi:DNA-binding LytR/AlgR family response regulator
MLALLGHEAHSATTAEEGIELLESVQFDVLFADINLPAMSGIELAKTATAIVPGIKVIFASGYGFLITDRTDFDFILLPKPYSLTQLADAIDGVREPRQNNGRHTGGRYARSALTTLSMDIARQRYGKQRWTLEQIKAELVYKTTWGSSVVADLVADIERLEARLQENTRLDKVPSATEG